MTSVGTLCGSILLLGSSRLATVNHQEIKELDLQSCEWPLSM